LEGDISKSIKLREAQQDAFTSYIELTKLKAFSEVVVCNKIADGIKSLLLTSGLGEFNFKRL